MAIEEPHIALPKLYGAPAYARPPVPVVPAPRPFDPDTLPLDVEQTPDEREATMMPARAYEASRVARPHQQTGRDGPLALRARVFSLRAIAGRLLGGD